MRTRQNYGWLDRFRVVAALLAITNHTSALASINEGADFFLTRVLARIVVPFFLMVTGQFAAAQFLEPSPENGPRLMKYLRKTSILYVFCILLYLPIGIYAGHYQEMTVGAALRMVIFDGTFYHLWYFPASILGMLIVYLMSRKLKLWAMTVISSLLYVIGLFGDSYYGLAQKVPALDAVYEFGFQFFSYTRNGLFMAPLFLVLGMWMSVRADKLGLDDSGNRQTDSVLIRSIGGLTFSFALMTVEAFVLRSFRLQRHDSMYLALIPTMFFLYQCLLCLPKSPSKACRSASTWIYILHPAFIVVVRALGKILKQTELLVDNSVVHYRIGTLVCAAGGLLAVYIERNFLPQLPFAGRSPSESALRREKNAPSQRNEAFIQKSGGLPAGKDFPPQEIGPFSHASQEQRGPAKRGSRAPKQEPAPLPKPQREVSFDSRAWIEINAAALAHNVAFLRSRLPAHCRLMPAVKAEAYGHGAVIISRLLNQLNVDAFCVACVSEGIALRAGGVKGEILILGFTAPEDLPLVSRYRLTQTVVDFHYAKLLEQSGEALHVHIAIDTGMHRLGIRCERIEEIFAVYEMQNLIVDGLFTHLSVSDSLRPQHKAFTDSQIQAFYEVVSLLEGHGYPCRGLHLLASYGVLNLLHGEQAPDGSLPQKEDAQTLSYLAADYVRPGIALYGVLSTEADSDIREAYLQPVLSLKARVASVRPLYAGEAAGYGLAYTAEQDMRIAVLSIGYADGLPRELSYGKGRVLIKGVPAPIIGRICMDQTIVDVGGVPDIHAGDIAVIIGRSGSQEITAEHAAQQCNTITNELLSRLGSRLERVVVRPSNKR